MSVVAVAVVVGIHGVEYGCQELVVGQRFVGLKGLKRFVPEIFFLHVVEHPFVDTGVCAVATLGCSALNDFDQQ